MAEKENSMATIYEENGFKDRKSYLIDLDDTHNIDEQIVSSMAEVLGESEDFDGLVTGLQDIEAGDGGMHGGWDGD